MTDPQPSGGFRWTQAPWGAALECVPLAAVAPHIFTVGNLRLAPEDDDEWRAVAALMQVQRGDLRLIRQVHGVAVALADGDRPPLPPQADIVLSRDPSLAVGVRVADCAPILLADRASGAVGAVHAGWRGTVQGAARVAVETMTRSFGTSPADIVAAIGPCLGPCCGEVGPEVVEAFRAAGHGEDDVRRWFKTGATGRPYLDLWLANRDQLRDAGVPGGQVHTAGICTKTHAALMHSYRATQGMAGRMAAVIRGNGERTPD